MQTASILQSLPLLASVLGRRYGVTVRIGGAEAYTDGKVIQLPALPAQHDDTFNGIVRGYIDHEAAHIRHTDFAMCKLVRSPLEKHIWNTFEDWRVENAMAAIYPGCRGNFRWLIRHCFLSTPPTVCDDKATLILDWLLFTVRSWDEPDLFDHCEALASAMDTRWPWLRLHLEVILHTMRGHCPDSGACLDYARQFIDVLKTAASTHAQDRQKSQGSCPKPPGRKGKMQDNCAEPGQAISQPETEKSMKITQGEPDGSPSSCSPENRLLSSPSSSGQADADALETLLSMPADALPADMGTRIGSTLATTVQAGPATGTVMVAREGYKFVSVLTPDAIREAKRATNGMAARFHGLLQATHLARSGSARRGRLDTRSLHKIAGHDPRIFLRHIQRPGINTAVHILLDCSGSMRKRISLACRATHAVATALERTGINVGVTAFPAEFRDGTEWNSLKPLVRHGQKVHTHFSLASGGQTPLGPALWWVMQELLPLKEDRKIILIMTDGDPDCPTATADAMQMAKRIGVELYGIGIMSTSIQSLLPGASTVIWELPEIAPAMFGMLRQALLPRTP